MYQLCIDSLIYIWYFYIIKFYDQTMKNLLLLVTSVVFIEIIKFLYNNRNTYFMKLEKLK